MFEPHEIVWGVLALIIFLILCVYTIKSIMEDKKDGR